MQNKELKNHLPENYIDYFRFLFVIETILTNLSLYNTKTEKRKSKIKINKTPTPNSPQFISFNTIILENISSKTQSRFLYYIFFFWLHKKGKKKLGNIIGDMGHRRKKAI